MADIKETFSVRTAVTANKVVQMINDGKINDLPIFTGGTINRNTQNTILSTTMILSPQAIKLDATRVLLLYYYSGLSSYAVVLTISGNTITAGTAVQVLAVTDAMDVRGALISTDKVLVAGTQGSPTFAGTAYVLTIAGSVITKNTGITYSAAPGSSQPFYPNVVQLATDKAVITWQEQNTICSKVATITGTTIALSTSYNVTNPTGGNSGRLLKALLLSTDKVFMAFAENAYGKFVYGIIATISGTTVAYSSQGRVPISRVTTDILDIALVDANRVMLVAATSSNSSLNFAPGKINIVTVSGTTITDVTEGKDFYLLPVGATAGLINYTSDISIAPIDSAGNFLVAGEVYNGNNSNRYTQVLIAVNVDANNRVTVLATNTYDSVGANGMYSPAAVQIASNSVVIAYCRNDGTNYRTHAHVINTTDLGVKGQAVGIQQVDGSTLLKGVSKGHSGLEVGSKYYYVPATGALTTSPSGNVYVGLAISDTEILVEEFLAG